jgi:PadR family transcriptional regulator
MGPLTQNEILILAALRGSELFGREVMQEVESMTEGRYKLALGGLYTTLHRMEKKGFISGRWVTVGQMIRTRNDATTGLLDSDNGSLLTPKLPFPRQIRSPWLDDLLSDRERMIGEGRSRRFVATATAVQCLSLLLHFVFGRVWDLLTPFKSRS